MQIDAIVLTYNEELHLRRCIESLKKIGANIFVIDSFSTDRTLAICDEESVQVVQRKWVNYADQFGWGLANLNFESNWVMRMDADEYLSEALVKEINTLTSDSLAEYNGINLSRIIKFQNRELRYGGMHPKLYLRIWRRGIGRIENRWMDEHIIIDIPKIYTMKAVFYDENLNSIGWWIDKHNKYASRECLDLLLDNFNTRGEEIMMKDSQASRVRGFKSRYYNTLPLFIRSFIYFVYRYIFLLGFMDGKSGFLWHFLQGLWYRLLVDLKYLRVKQMMYRGISLEKAVKQELGIDKIS